MGIKNAIRGIASKVAGKVKSSKSPTNNVTEHDISPPYIQYKNHEAYVSLTQVVENLTKKKDQLEHDYATDLVITREDYCNKIDSIVGNLDRAKKSLEVHSAQLQDEIAKDVAVAKHCLSCVIAIQEGAIRYFGSIDGKKVMIDPAEKQAITTFARTRLANIAANYVKAISVLDHQYQVIASRSGKVVFIVLFTDFVKMMTARNVETIAAELAKGAAREKLTQSVIVSIAKKLLFS